MNDKTIKQDEREGPINHSKLVTHQIHQATKNAKQVSKICDRWIEWIYEMS